MTHKHEIHNPSCVTTYWLVVSLQCNRGRVPTPRWVFGIMAVQYNPSRPIFHIVQRSDARTLEPIISHHCLPGTTIWSDGWVAYRNLKRLGYQHSAVNHRQNFVDPATGESTKALCPKKL